MAVARDFRDRAALGFTVERDNGLYRWVRHTYVGEAHGTWLPTLTDALRAAVAEWARIGGHPSAATVTRVRAEALRLGLRHDALEQASSSWRARHTVGAAA